MTARCRNRPNASYRDLAEDNRERRERLTTLLGNDARRGRILRGRAAAQAQGVQPAGGPGRGAGIPRPEHVHARWATSSRSTTPETAARKSRPSCAATTSARKRWPCNWRRATRKPSKTCATTWNSARRASQPDRPARHAGEAVRPASLRLAGRGSAPAGGPAPRRWAKSA